MSLLKRLFGRKPEPESKAEIPGEAILDADPPIPWEEVKIDEPGSLTDEPKVLGAEDRWTDAEGGDAGHIIDRAMGLPESGPEPVPPREEARGITHPELSGHRGMYTQGWSRYGTVPNDDGRTIEEWETYAREWAAEQGLEIYPGSIVVRRRVGEGKVKVAFDARRA